MNLPADSKLPGNWAMASLRDILPISYGKGLPERERNPGGPVPVYGSSGIVGTHDMALTSRETLVIGRKGNVGAVHYSAVPCWPIDTVYCVEGSRHVELRYFAYLLRWLRLDTLDRSTAVPGLSRDDYNKVQAPIAPLPEQRRIVAAIESYLSRLDAATAALDRVQRNLARFRASVLHAAVTGRLVPTEAELARAEGREYEPASVLLARILVERRRRWEEAELAKMVAKGKPPTDDRWKAKYKEPVAPDAEGLGELPEGWCWATVDQLVSISQNGLGKRQSDEGKPTIVLRLSDIEDGRVIVTEPRRIGLTRDEVAKYGLSSIDLLCIRVNGSRELVGRVIPCSAFAESVAFCDHFIRLSPSHPALARFLALALNGETARRRVSLNMVSSAGQNTISQGTMLAIPLALPPMAEQVRITAVVDQYKTVADQVVRSIVAMTHHTSRLRQSILRWAFEGRLVDQDPSDEPAALLLERIRAEREVEPPSNRRRHREGREILSHNRLL